jgi:NAD(P)H-dependent FMN reductase
MPVLLVVHHTPSPALQSLLEAARAGAALVPGVDVVTRPALSAGAVDLLAADAVLLGTPANLGYMSGALKHFFDTVYYPCLEAKVGMPYGVYVHGQSDTTGAVRSIEKATTGMKWRLVAAPVLVVGEPSASDREAVTELGGTLAATIG